MRHPAFVSTSVKGGGNQSAIASLLSDELGIPLVKREDRSEIELLRTFRDSFGEGMSDIPYIIVGRDRIILKDGDPPGSGFFFHPNMATLRVKTLTKGGRDNLVEAMALRPGDKVLDCTLGLASDAIVVSSVTGETVIGMEASPVISAIIRHGLTGYSTGFAPLDDAMRRIRVVTGNHEDYLSRLQPRSFDCIYFDPMFRNPEQGAGMQGMRESAYGSEVSLDSIRSAMAATGRCVVLKEARGSSEFDRLGFNKLCGGKYSRVAYGVREKNGEDPL